jgi:hypothetical protein
MTRGGVESGKHQVPEGYRWVEWKDLAPGQEVCIYFTQKDIDHTTEPPPCPVSGVIREKNDYPPVVGPTSNIYVAWNRDGTNYETCFKKGPTLVVFVKNA